MTTIPGPRAGAPTAPGGTATGGHRPPGAALRAHAESLRTQADRLRAAVDALAWTGPDADALRARVTALATRCDRAATDLARSAELV
ncbi:hypothetical protein [Streptomyces sp. NRRL S-87]|uniref:hypothetical protein n=1 Tax=Streptomyces sp. NRRL S-87 TaxID=1463920 RepID=UPI0004C0F2FD|nr:hypothetical protein [Streptomyces sp. NRRL S-87]